MRLLRLDVPAAPQGFAHTGETPLYPPINTYGAIGDCHSVVLIAPDGSIDWACLPDFDSPAIFYRLLDAERGGYFQIAPTGGMIPGRQRYLRDSNVLQTTFTSISAEVVLTDFMPVQTLSARPDEDDSFRGLVRAVECTRGEMQVTLTLKVSPQYANSPCVVRLAPQNTGAIFSGGGQHVGLAIIGASDVSTFSLDLSQDGDEQHPSLNAQMTLCEGERLLFVLGMAHSARAARRLVQRELPRRDFDRELAQTLCCLGRFSEEVDSGTRMAPGNYPQSFSHLGSINSVLNLQRAEKRLARREHHLEPVFATVQWQDTTTRKRMAA